MDEPRKLNFKPPPTSSPSNCRLSKTDQAERIIEIRSEPQHLINTNKKRLRSPSNQSTIKPNGTTASGSYSLQSYRDYKGLLNLAHKCSFRSRSSHKHRFLAPADASMPRSLSVNYLYQKRQGLIHSYFNKLDDVLINYCLIIYR